MIFLNELRGLVECGRTHLLSSFHSLNTHTAKVFDAPVNNHATVDYTLAPSHLLWEGLCAEWLKDVLETPTVFRTTVGIFTCSSSLSLDIGISEAELLLCWYWNGPNFSSYICQAEDSFVSRRTYLFFFIFFFLFALR